EGGRTDLGDCNGQVWTRSVPGQFRDRSGNGDVRSRIVRTAGPLFPLDLWQGVSSDEDDVRLRPLQDLRSRYQLQPVVRVSAGDELADSEQAGHCARPWPRRFLQEQRLFLEDQQADGGRSSHARATNG